MNFTDAQRAAIELATPAVQRWLDWCAKNDEAPDARSGAAAVVEALGLKIAAGASPRSSEVGGRNDPPEHTCPMAVDPDSVFNGMSVINDRNGVDLAWVHDQSVAQWLVEVGNAAADKAARDRIVPRSLAPEGSYGPTERAVLAVFENHPGPFRQVELWQRIEDPPAQSAVSAALLTLRGKGLVRQNPDRTYSRV